MRWVGPNLDLRLAKTGPNTEGNGMHVSEHSPPNYQWRGVPVDMAGKLRTVQWQSQGQEDVRLYSVRMVMALLGFCGGVRL